MPIVNFCTLFDSHYLLRGLALYESLTNKCPSFHLYILAMDSCVEDFFKKKNFPNITVISLSDFETTDLKNIKNERTKGEYCWTCTPAIIDYCLSKYALPSCTYLDADIFFFNSPDILISEAAGKSVLITPHNYSIKYDQTSTSGTYCVQFMFFKNDDAGRTALTWWKDRCIEWCFARHENGKFGDQKYLDDWTERFKGVHVLRNKAGALAPWNIQQFGVSTADGILRAERLNTEASDELPIFYHFHDLRLYADESCDLGIYKIPKAAISNIYAPYLRSIERQALIAPDATDRTQAPKFNFKKLVKNLKRLIRGNYNFFAARKLTAN